MICVEVVSYVSWCGFVGVVEKKIRCSRKPQSRKGCASLAPASDFAFPIGLNCAWHPRPSHSVARKSRRLYMQVGIDWVGIQTRHDARLSVFSYIGEMALEEAIEPERCWNAVQSQWYGRNPIIVVHISQLAHELNLSFCRAPFVNQWWDHFCDMKYEIIRRQIDVVVYITLSLRDAKSEQLWNLAYCVERSWDELPRHSVHVPGSMVFHTSIMNDGYTTPLLNERFLQSLHML